LRLCLVLHLRSQVLALVLNLQVQALLNQALVLVRSQALVQALKVLALAHLNLAQALALKVLAQVLVQKVQVALQYLVVLYVGDM
jgi:hypothetical protein